MRTFSKIMVGASTLLLCYMQLSLGKETVDCKLIKRDTIRPLLDLMKRLFDQKKCQEEQNIFAEELKQKNYDIESSLQRNKRLAVVNNLLSIVSQRESVMQMEGNHELMKELNATYERLYNNICKFLSNGSGIDCNNVNETRRVHQLLKLRQQARENFDSFRPLPDNDFYRNYQISYMIWHEVVAPNIEKAGEMVGTFGFTGSETKEVCNICDLKNCTISRC